MIVSAFQVAGGIQVNRQVDANTITCEMVFPEDEGWGEALAAAEYFNEEPEPAVPTIEDLRAHAAIDRYTFCSRCLEQSILSESDALELSHGNIPPATRAILDAMDPADSADAEMRWAGMMTARRLDPLIIATAAASGIPDIMLDHIFNIFPYSHEPEPEEAP